MASVPGLLACLLLFSGCGGQPQLVMPPLSDNDYHWIALRIFENETGGKISNLTHWGAGEDFPSFGIGHFIWFPAGVAAPFDETFPAMLADVSKRSAACAPLPGWLQERPVRAAPWQDKAGFDAAQDSAELAALRHWLASTAPQQAQFIVASFKRRWDELELEAGDKPQLTALLQRLLDNPQGMFAVIDYYNFKGLGSNPRERYAGEGWGLVQVLRDMQGNVGEPGATPLVTTFSAAAAARLARRVANAPAERNEARWLEGWHRRVADYADRTVVSAQTVASQYRVTPYLQSVSANRATITWFSEQPTPGKVRVDDTTVQSAATAPRIACELAYHLAEYRDAAALRSPPYRQQVVLDGLTAGKRYDIEIEQDGERATVQLRVPAQTTARFVVYGDSETEPESAGSHVPWPEAGAADSTRRYLVDQTSGYAANLDIILQSKVDFIAIAGDLVESGGEQRDWDEFWWHNARVAASLPIVPAAGNHDYFGGPRDLGGYGGAASQRALAKYRSYFGREQYYVVNHGPVALIVIDANNGQPERSAADTNWYLNDTAPGWQEGSAQFSWLRAVLEQAQRDKAFTFVMFHPAPYSSGIHGKPPGTADDQNFSSGQPLRALSPLFTEFGVDAVFNGHDEMYERSAVRGIETTPDGAQRDHTLHFFTVGIGGDGLRGIEPGVSNPQSLFIAETDSPEIYSADGRLQDGGKHYGHLLVDVTEQGQGRWRARIEPVYAFPVMTADGELARFERRVYDDVLVLESRDDD